MSSKNKGKNKNKGGNKGGNKPANDDVPQVNQPQTEKKESSTLPEIAENTQNEGKTEKQETPTVHDQNSNTDVSRNQELSQTALDHPEDTKLQKVEVNDQSKESEHAEISPKLEEPLQVQTKVETSVVHEEPGRKTEEPERQAQDRHEQVLQNVESSNKELQNSETKEEAKEQESEPERAISEQRDSTEFQIISSGDFTKVENVQNLPIVEEENTNPTNKNETVEEVQATHSEPVQRREDKTEPSQNEKNPYLSTEILVERKQNVPVETLQEEVVDNHQQIQPETAPKVEEPPHELIEEKPSELNHGNEQKREETSQENPTESEIHVNPPRQQEPQREQPVQNIHNQLHQQTSKVQPLSQSQNNSQVPPSSEQVIDLNRPMDQESSTKKKKEETIFRLVESKEISVNESNQISVDGSLEIKRSDEVKEVPVKESLSFSDLNYSIERSASASQEQERVPLINQLDPVDQIVRQENTNESILSDHAHAPLLVEVPQAVFVSQPVEILVDNDPLPYPSPPSEQFYSIIPEQPMGMVFQTETVVVEHQIIISEDGVVQENERVIDRKVEQEVIELNPQQGTQQLQSIPIIEPIIVEQVQSVPVVVPIEQNVKQDVPENPREIVVEAQPGVEVVPQPVVEAVPQQSVEKVAAVPANEPEVVSENAVPEVPLATVEQEKKDLSQRLQMSERADAEPQQEKEKQIDPVEIKTEKSVLKKLVISTAIGGVAGGAFYLFKSNKTGSLLLGLASLAASYFAV